MLKTVFALLILIAAAHAQSYTLAETGTLTASGGDGTSCTVTKGAGPAPSLLAVCLPGNNGPAATLTVSQKAGAASGSTFQVGDITCMILMNATATPAVVGGIAVPASGAALACSVNVRSSGPSGPVTSQATVPVQTLTWP